MNKQGNQQVSKPLYMAYATQKGGVGKTTFTVLTASYLHYAKGYNVLVVDCDYPQCSIHRLREREIETAKTVNEIKQMAIGQFTRLNKKAYTILQTSLEKAKEDVENFLGNSEVNIDFVLFDIPGTVNTSGMFELLTALDVFLIPMSADRVILESCLNFAKAIDKMLKKDQQKHLYLFWNMVDRREKTSLYDVYTKGILSLGLFILKTRIPDTKRYRKEMLQVGQLPFRSTLFPPNKRIAKGSNIIELVEEIIGIVSE